MNQDRNEKSQENPAWKVVNDSAELDDLLNLALRDLKRKFDQSFETKFEKTLSWDGYPEPDQGSE